eukprot:515220-Amorphochlora_amoeboformis.AAC.1
MKGVMVKTKPKPGMAKLCAEQLRWSDISELRSVGRGPGRFGEFEREVLLLLIGYNGVVK